MSIFKHLMDIAPDPAPLPSALGGWFYALVAGVAVVVVVAVVLIVRAARRNK